ncbi:MAG TPA: Rieske 2Fe-2S domain-containing protein [Anaerolineales bacterium]
MASSESPTDVLSRRDFIKGSALWIGGLIGAAIGAPILAYLFSPAFSMEAEGARISLGQLDEYPLGQPVFRQFTRTQVNGWERTARTYGVFVLRQEASSVRVLSNICTHLACHVVWKPELQHYVSPCHDGHFDVLGNNVSGPPPRPLDEFRVLVENGKLSIELPALRRDPGTEGS